MEQTTYYNLNKLMLDDSPVDITELNYNWDTLDTLLHEANADVTAILQAIQTLNTGKAAANHTHGVLTIGNKTYNGSAAVTVDTASTSTYGLTKLSTSTSSTSTTLAAAASAVKAAYDLAASKAAASHNHAASAINSGTLALARGGTGSGTAAGARANLGAEGTTKYYNGSLGRTSKTVYIQNEAKFVIVQVYSNLNNASGQRGAVILPNDNTNRTLAFDPNDGSTMWRAKCSGSSVYFEAVDVGGTDAYYDIIAFYD